MFVAYRESGRLDEDLRGYALFQESSAWVIQAHESVKGQTVPARHILVCDGAEPAQIPAFQGTHILLRRNYRDYGNTPR